VSLVFFNLILIFLYYKEKNYTNVRNREVSTTSTPIYLVGGMKYAIVVMVYHSNHNFYTENQNTFAKLYWSSEKFAEHIV